MSGKFEIHFVLDKNINSKEDIKLLQSETDKALDACDCGAKGVVLCQVYLDEFGTAHIIGKFINNDVAKKVVELSKYNNLLKPIVPGTLKPQV